ncbi:hypothetical protein LI020_23515, partial [[Clostridium] symbiosum]|uniref:hypothetical protein n=1 Tax=Clostridium symbiosum TaxID=1512 RepID=UPI001D065FDC
FPTGRLWPETEDAKVVAIPIPGLRPLNCSYSFKGGEVLSLPLHFLEFRENASLYSIQLMTQSFSA